MASAPMSVRQQGMGNVSVGGGDVLRAWSNPALLAEQSRRGEVAVGGASLFGGDQSSLGLGLGYMLNPSWVMGLMAYSYSQTLDELDVFGEPVGESVARSVRAVALSTAFKLGPVRAGVSLKGLADSLGADVVSTGAADAGVAMSVVGLTAGVAVRNLGGGLRPAEGSADAEVLPMEIRAGASYRYFPWRLGAGVEYLTAAEREGSLGVGLEWWPTEMFGVRAGTASLSAKEFQLTLGLSAALKGIGIDYAMGSHVLGASHRAALSYQFGPTPLELSGTQAAARAARLAAEPDPEPEPEPDPEPVPVADAPVTPAVKPAAKSGKLNIAVADLTAQNVSAGDAAVVADMLRSELIKMRKANVVERANMEKVLAEHAFQQTGCTTDECAVKIGKLLNVNRLIVGSFGKLLGSYLLSVRVVDVESGAIIFGDTARGDTVDEIGTAVNKLAARIGKTL